MGRSRSRERYQSRKRSRSRSRRDDDRERRHKSSRTSHRSSRKRSRSRSPIASTSNSLGGAISILPPSSGAPVPTEIARELTSEEKFDSSQLSRAAMDWLEEKIVEQVSARVRDFEELVRDRVAKAKVEMESRLRAQIEQEMKDEMDLMQKREKESKDRCTAMEKALEQKIKQVEESEKKLSEERLQMLEVKGKLEMERAEIRREKEELNKTEQLSILNKGGGMRAPIRLKLGK